MPCVRVDRNMDALSYRTIETILKCIVPWKTLLWASIPCAGGSPWRSVNAGTPEGAERSKAHQETAPRLWEVFENVARQVLANHGYVTIEWAQCCAYWKWPKVKLFLVERRFDDASTHDASEVSWITMASH